MTSPFRFETKIDLYAFERGEPSADVTVGLYCGEVLLGQSSEEDLETNDDIQQFIKNSEESMATTLGNALNDLMRKGGYTS